MLVMLYAMNCHNSVRKEIFCSWSCKCWNSHLLEKNNCVINLFLKFTLKRNEGFLLMPKCLLKTIFSKWKQKKTKYPLKTNEQTNRQQQQQQQTVGIPRSFNSQRERNERSSRNKQGRRKRYHPCSGGWCKVKC